MDNIMIDTKAVIDSLRDLYENMDISVDKAYEIIEKNDPYSVPSRSTIARVLRRNGGYNFRWETTIRPIANALLDTKKESTTSDTYKSILKLKKDKISDLEDQIEELKQEIVAAKQKYRDKLDKELAKYQKSLDFAMKQIELKDKRIDQLMDANMALQGKLLNCSSCKEK